VKEEKSMEVPERTCSREIRLLGLFRALYWCYYVLWCDQLRGSQPDKTQDAMHIYSLGGRWKRSIESSTGLGIERMVDFQNHHYDD
jgi:hypothetical protein